MGSLRYLVYVNTKYAQVVVYTGDDPFLMYKQYKKYEINLNKCSL